MHATMQVTKIYHCDSNLKIMYSNINLGKKKIKSITTDAFAPNIKICKPIWLN